MKILVLRKLKSKATGYCDDCIFLSNNRQCDIIKNKINMPYNCVSEPISENNNWIFKLTEVKNETN